jgi:hypothetical protein
MGRRGLVEIRDAGSQVPLTALSPTVATIPSNSVTHANAYSQGLISTRTFAEANTIMRQSRGTTELDYETQKSASRSATKRGLPLAEQVDVITKEARLRGADFITVRRLVEVAGFTSVDTAALVAMLANHDSRRLDPPLWDVRAII